MREGLLFAFLLALAFDGLAFHHAIHRLIENIKVRVFEFAAQPLVFLARFLGDGSGFFCLSDAGHP